MVNISPNYYFDTMLTAISLEIADSDLPDAEFKIGIWNAKLKNGALEVPSNFSRQGDTCLHSKANSGKMEELSLSGTARLTDLKAEYTAKVSGVSKDVSGTVEYVDFAINATIYDFDTCKITLTQCDITVGDINVPIGNYWADFVVNSLVTKATTKISNYLIDEFEDELCTALQNYMDNEMDFVDFCADNFPYF